MISRVFCYGTLRFADILQAVIGRVPTSYPATLADHACYAVKARPYPAMVPEPGVVTQGCVYEGLTPADIFKLDRYEGPEYARRRVEVETYDGVAVTAWGYAWKMQYHSRLLPEQWDIKLFERRCLPAYLARLNAERLK